MKIKKELTHGSTLTRNKIVPCSASKVKERINMSYRKFKLIKEILLRAKKDLSNPETLEIVIRLNKLN